MSQLVAVTIVKIQLVMLARNIIGRSAPVPHPASALLSLMNVSTRRLVKMEVKSNRRFCWEIE